MRPLTTLISIQSVLKVFRFSTTILKKLSNKDAGTHYIRSTLSGVNEKLKEYDSSFLITTKTLA